MLAHLRLGQRLGRRLTLPFRPCLRRRWRIAPRCRRRLADAGRDRRRTAARSRHWRLGLGLQQLGQLIGRGGGILAIGNHAPHRLFETGLTIEIDIHTAATTRRALGVG
jgi:hypothetical protein